MGTTPGKSGISPPNNGMHAVSLPYAFALRGFATNTSHYQSIFKAFAVPPLNHNVAYIWRRNRIALVGGDKPDLPGVVALTNFLSLSCYWRFTKFLPFMSVSSPL